jgi:hypothetical protein
METVSLYHQARIDFVRWFERTKKGAQTKAPCRRYTRCLKPDSSVACCGTGRMCLAGNMGRKAICAAVVHRYSAVRANFVSLTEALVATRIVHLGYQQELVAPRHSSTNGRCYITRNSYSGWLQNRNTRRYFGSRAPNSNRTVHLSDSCFGSRSIISGSPWVEVRIC